MKQEHTRRMTIARKKADCMFAEKRCKMWHWKRARPMSTVGGMYEDSAMKIGRQTGTKEIGGELKDLGV